MTRASASRPGRSGNMNLVGSNPGPSGFNTGQVKPMTFKLIVVVPSPVLTIGQAGCLRVRKMRHKGIAGLGASGLMPHSDYIVTRGDYIVTMSAPCHKLVLTSPTGFVPQL